MALLDIRNIPFEVSLKLTDDEIIAIETSSLTTSYANYESIVVNNTKAEVAPKSFLNISFDEALKMTDAEIIALETGVLVKDLPPPPKEPFQKDPISSSLPGHLKNSTLKDPQPQNPLFPLKDPIPDPIPSSLLGRPKNPTPFALKGPQPQSENGPSFPTKDPIVPSSFTGLPKNPNSLPLTNLQPQSPPADEPDEPESDISKLDEQDFYLARLRRIRFIRDLETEDTRRSYKIVADASVSMFNQQYNSLGETVFDYLWLEAKKVVCSLVSKVTRCDMQGATVVFFSGINKTTSHGGICTSEQAAALFKAKENKLKGGRYLNDLLKGIIADGSQLSPSSVLILLGGLPSESEEALQLLLEASSKSDVNVRLSFVQVGDDASAKEWLESLASKPELRRFVDITTLTSMRGKWLSEVVDFLFEYTTGY